MLCDLVTVSVEDAYLNPQSISDLRTLETVFHHLLQPPDRRTDAKATVAKVGITLLGFGVLRFRASWWLMRRLFS